MNAFPILLVVVALFVQQSLSLECYSCPSTPCPISTAQKTRCGENIGAGKQAFCTKAVRKGEAQSQSAIRRCQVTNAGQEPDCNNDFVCTNCKSDLCNAGNALHFGKTMMFGVVAIVMAVTYSI